MQSRPCSGAELKHRWGCLSREAIAGVSKPRHRYLLRPSLATLRCDTQHRSQAAAAGQAGGSLQRPSGIGVDQHAQPRSSLSIKLGAQQLRGWRCMAGPEDSLLSSLDFAAQARTAAVTTAAAVLLVMSGAPAVLPASGAEPALGCALVWT